jgi:ABC-type oligopeptide transport system substrate-binding subunit
MVRKKRVIAAVSALALAGLGLAACGGGGSGDAKPGELRYPIGEPKSLIPPNTTESEGSTVEDFVYAGLYDYNKDGTLKPIIAKSEPTTKDNIHFTIKLNSGWKFQNGEDITAQTFVDTINYGAYGPNANTGTSFYTKIAGYDDLQGKKPKSKKMSGLKAKDDTTLEITLSKQFVGYPQLLGYTAYLPMAQACIKDVDACNTKPIGNGPFKMDGKWDHKKQIDLKRWSGWKGEEPNIKSVHFKILTGETTSYPDFQAGKLDLATPNSDQYEEAKDKYGSDMIEEKTSATWGLGFPVYDKVFKDPKVRKAFSMAIDREAYNKGVFQGRKEVADSWTPPPIPGYKQGTCGDLCTFDKKEAQKLLDESSYPKGKKVTLWTEPSPQAKKYTKVIGDQLKENLGLSYELKALEWPDLLEKKQKHALTGPFMTGWLPDYPLNEDYLYPLYGVQPNDFGYNNKAFNDAVDQGNTANSIEDAEKKYQKAEEMLAADPPVAPIYIDKTSTLLGDRVVHDSYERNPVLGGFDIFKLKLKD